jgi:hypothetical protein
MREVLNTKGFKKVSPALYNFARVEAEKGHDIKVTSSGENVFVDVYKKHKKLSSPSQRIVSKFF